VKIKTKQSKRTEHQRKSLTSSIIHSLSHLYTNFRIYFTFISTTSSPSIRIFAISKGTSLTAYQKQPFLTLANHLKYQSHLFPYKQHPGNGQALQQPTTFCRVPPFRFAVRQQNKQQKKINDRLLALTTERKYGG
jgi:hypothetical protein